MNEADNSIFGDFTESVNNSNLFDQKQVNCPFDSVLPEGSKAIPQLPPAKSAPDNLSDNSSKDRFYKETKKVFDCEVNGTFAYLEEKPINEEKQQDWVAEPDIQKQQQVEAEFKQILALNNDLRQNNDELYHRVEELTKVLAESEKTLQWYKNRASVAELMLNQQAKEFCAAQEQSTSLCQQLETALQTIQRQEFAIESSRGQLEITQQRLAQLERDCALLQTNYNDQSYKLLQSENSCRELRTRLMRQQRQTLQFKAALEKCLDTPIPAYDADGDSNLQDFTPFVGLNKSNSKSHISFTQPIKPWCVDTPSIQKPIKIQLANPSDDSLTSDAKEVVTEPVTKVISVDNDDDENLVTIDTFAENSEPGNIEINAVTVSDTVTDTDRAIASPVNPVNPVNPLDIENISQTAGLSDSQVKGETIGQQLENLLQKFFQAPVEFSNPTTAKPNNEPSNQSSVNQSSVNQSPVVIDNLANNITENQVITKASGKQVKEETEDVWAESAAFEFTANTAPIDYGNNYSSNSNSPSPVINSKTSSQKKKKSLAAVELPNFKPIVQ
jgi:hypothetical protein